MANRIFQATVTATNIADPGRKPAESYVMTIEQALSTIEHIEVVAVDGQGVFRIFTFKLTPRQQEQLKDRVAVAFNVLGVAGLLRPHRGVVRLSWSDFEPEAL